MLGSKLPEGSARVAPCRSAAWAIPGVFDSEFRTLDFSPAAMAFISDRSSASLKGSPWLAFIVRPRVRSLRSACASCALLPPLWLRRRLRLRRGLRLCGEALEHLNLCHNRLDTIV